MRDRAILAICGSPVVRAEELNLRGDELPAELNQDERVWTTREAIRTKVGQLMGIQVSRSIPKISFIAPARDYRTVTGAFMFPEKAFLHMGWLFV